MAKSPQMQDFLDGFTKKAFSRVSSESAASQTCVVCGGDANVFTDELSRKEYGISRLCQECQDKVFGKEE